MGNQKPQLSTNSNNIMKKHTTLQLMLNKSKTRVLKKTDIRNTFNKAIESNAIPGNTGFEETLLLLLERSELKRIELDFPSRKETRYVWTNVSPYEIALSIDPKCYLCHYSAVAIHQLTEQSPTSIYVNREQSPKPKPAGGLSQDAIHNTFKKAQRTTTNTATYDGYSIIVLSGKHTGGLGVIEFSINEDLPPFRVTNLERTLIDITVRPYYAGGIAEVLKAYQNAASHVSVNKLAATLKQLDYAYPYHQAIGFYLERSGVYRNAQIGLMEKPGLDFDFYLTYGMKEKEYSDRWRLFFPKGF